MTAAELRCPPGATSRAYAVMREALARATDPNELESLTRVLSAAYANGQLSDIEASEISAQIERLRPWYRNTPRLRPLPDQFGRLMKRIRSRQHPRSPDQEASRARRRTMGGSSTMPPAMRAFYTEGLRAVLCVIAGEVKKHGVCDWPIDRIAALAGVCRTTVQTALHEARRLGHIEVTERPRRGAKNLPNVVRIIAAKWRSWLGVPKKGGLGSKNDCPTESHNRNKTTEGSTLRDQLSFLLVFRGGTGAASKDAGSPPNATHASHWTAAR